MVIAFIVKWGALVTQAEISFWLRIIQTSSRWQCAKSLPWQSNFWKRYTSFSRIWIILAIILQNSQILFKSRRENKWLGTFLLNGFTYSMFLLQCIRQNFLPSSWSYINAKRLLITVFHFYSKWDKSYIVCFHTSCWFFFYYPIRKAKTNCRKSLTEL